MFASQKLSLFAVVISSLILSACGGGGGGGQSGGGIPVVDAELTFSALAGNLTLAVGERVEYELTISDGDGIGSVSAELLDASDAVVQALEISNTGNLYTVVLDAAELFAGLYNIEVSIVSVDGVTGANGEPVVVNLDIEIEALDAELTVSTISGDASLIVGESRNYTLTITDPDGIDSVSAELLDASDILVQSLPVSNTSDLYTLVLDSSGLAAGTYSVLVTATGSDGGVGENSGPITQTIDVAINPVPNSVPVAANLVVVDVNGGTTLVGDTLNGNYDYSDSEGDLEGASIFRWLRNGVTIAGATSPNYVVSVLDSGTQISFQVTPVALSGPTTGSAVVSPFISISNSAPFAENLVVSDANGGNAVVGDELEGSYDYRDIDEDLEGATTFRWLRDSVAISGATTNTYTLVTADSGAEISFEVTPIAVTGEASGSAVVSSVVSVTNSAPVAENVAISDINGGLALSGDNLQGSYDYSDVDADAEGVTTFRWLRDGLAISGATADSYTLIDADVGEDISFEVTPVANAGETNGDAVESSTISVTNLSPTASVVFPSTSVDTFTNQNSIAVRGSASDSDGTVVSVEVNGVAATTSDGYASWVASISLSAGENDLTVSVTDNVGGSNAIADSLTVRQAPTILFEPVAIAEDLANDLIYVLDTSGDPTIYAFDTVNESYTVVSNSSVGTGAGFGIPISMVFDSANDVLFVSDVLSYTNAIPQDVTTLIEVDIFTGNRTVVAHNDSLIPAVGSGPDITFGHSLSLDEPNQTLLVADFTGAQVVSVDVDTGSANYLDRTQIAVVGLPQYVSLDSTIPDLAYVYEPSFVTTGTFSSLVLSTGVLTTLSEAGTGTGDIPQFVENMVFDSSNARLLVADSATNTIYAIDTTTGNRTVVSDGSTGTGIAATGDMFLDLDVANDVLLVATNDQNGVIEIDLSDSSRSLLTPNTLTATGTELSHPSEIIADSFNSRYLVLDANTNRIVAVDEVTGARSLVANISENLENQDSSGMAIDSLNELAYVFTNNPSISFIGNGDDALIEVNLNTGVNTVISQNGGAGLGTDLSLPTSIAFDPANDRVLITDTTNGLVEVDTTTGERAILSNAANGTGTSMISPVSIALDTNNEIAYVADDNLDALFVVDISAGANAGNRTILSDGSNGSGPGFVSPTGVWFDESSARILVADQDGITSRFIAVDVTTGNRTVLADLSSGSAGECPVSFEFDDANNFVVGIDSCSQSIVLTDLVTEQNVVFSK